LECVEGHVNSKVLIKLINIMNDEAINKFNHCGETALYKLCFTLYNINDILLELIDRMSYDAINKQTKYGNTALTESSKHCCMLKVSLKLIDRMSDEAINYYDSLGFSAFLRACNNETHDLALKILERMNKNNNILDQSQIDSILHQSKIISIVDNYTIDHIKNCMKCIFVKYNNKKKCLTI